MVVDNSLVFSLYFTVILILISGASLDSAARILFINSDLSMPPPARTLYPPSMNTTGYP